VYFLYKILKDLQEYIHVQRKYQISLIQLNDDLRFTNDFVQLQNNTNRILRRNLHCINVSMLYFESTNCTFCSNFDFCIKTKSLFHVLSSFRCCILERKKKRKKKEKKERKKKEKKTRMNI